VGAAESAKLINDAGGLDAALARHAARPMVTVVIPTWLRRGLLLGRAIPSVLEQSFTDWECVVVSDGPDPATQEALSSAYGALPGIRWAHVPEHSLLPTWGAVARRLGAAEARGRVVAYLDDDNAWRPDHLAILCEALRVHPEVDFAYTRMRVVQDGMEIGADPPTLGQIDSSMLAHRAGVLERFGNWSEPPSPYAVDWDIVERWLKAGARWAYVPTITVDYWRREG
jgi:glycosyltransferase involved in cell wall biosynthesis